VHKSKYEYNDEPVHYCSSCLSLHIKNLDVGEEDGITYCNDCGGTKIKKTSIEEWNRKWVELYEEPLLKRNIFLSE